MDFPTFEKNATKPTQALTVDSPAFDGANASKSVEQKRVEQQWRDVVANDLHRQHPLSLNRDADQVTADPYTTP